jgi:glycosyltransferase involved in cell wall biosynthesis
MSGLVATVAQVLARHSREFDRPICEVNDLVGPADESDTFLATSRLCRELLTRWLADAAQCAGQRRLFDLAGTLPLAAMAMLAHLPYLAAFATQHKDDGLLRNVAKHFKLPGRQRHVPQRRLWATDTLLDVNGVAKTIQAVCKVARDRGCTLRVMTSRSDTSDAVEAVEMDVKNFEPLIEFPLPLYWQQRVGVPPLLDVVEYIERESISEIIVSTPGPVGLVAGLAGRLLGIPVRGIYHTDFPAYVRHLTGNEHLEEITTGLMRRLYGACEEVLAPSDAYRQRLEAMGLAKTKLRVLPRGVDTGLFHPNRRDEAYWARHGIDEPLVFLYVGRVSEEKNIELLLSEFSDLINSGFRAGLAIVGDGPARVRLEQRYPHREIRFTGFLDGHCLATAYASADVFVFPSTSDTFGNVVLEAQSSGLPAIVSDRGGPAEILGRNDSGFIVPVDRHGALRSAMQTYIEQPWLRGEHGQRARQNALQSSWAMVFEMLWGSAPPAESLGEKFQAPQISTHAAEVA